MGGGGLRILGHKSWHVWKGENIERVKRDERLEKERIAKEAADVKRRDQEYRLERLREKEGRKEKPFELFPVVNEKQEPTSVEKHRDTIAPVPLGGRHQQPWYTLPKTRVKKRKNESKKRVEKRVRIKKTQQVDLKTLRQEREMREQKERQRAISLSKGL